MAVNIDLKKANYKKWLSMGQVNRPLTGLLLEQDIPPYRPMIEKIGYGKRLTPELFDPKDFESIIEFIYEQSQSVEEDLIQPINPAFGMPWVEAIAGCPVEAQSGSFWAEPMGNDFYESKKIVYDISNPWMQKLLLFTSAIVKQSDGRFPVALPQMRGPMDVLAAIRTPKSICLDLLERPEQVAERIAEITDLWISVALDLLKIIPPFHGGYSTRMRLFADRPAINPQNDSMTLISPRMYKKFFEESDRKIMGAFPYSSIHMHSTEYRHMPTILNYKDLSAIQLSLEHTVGGPPLKDMLEVSKMVLEKKPLILVAMDLNAAEIAIEELPARGLCLCVWFNEPAPIPAEYKEWVEKVTEKPY